MPDISRETAAELQSQGAQLRQRGRYDEAENCLLRALELEHDRVAAHLELALIYVAQDRFEDAVDYLELAVHFDPQCVAAWLELGHALGKRGRADAAIAACRRATVLAPRDAAAWIALGALYKTGENWASAIDCYRTAADCQPGSADALCLLGYALYKAGRYAESHAQFDAALKRAPAMPQIHHNLGLMFLETAQPDRALECFERAIAIAPDITETRACTAHALRDLGRLDEALARYDEVLAKDPRFADAVINRSYALLMKGDYAGGWAAYDERFASGGAIGRNFRHAPWRGEAPAGKRVLVYAEQGLGDEIMFASCVPDLLALDADCVIECNTRLASLFGRSFAQAHVHGGSKLDDQRWLAGLPPIDYQVAIGSLPRYLRGSADAFPPRSGYLKADRVRVEYWRSQFRSNAALRVGIAWRGGSLRSRQFARSIPLSIWTPLLRTGSIDIHALQYGDVAAELAELRKQTGISLAPAGAATNDLDEQAAIISALDLVISVDNTVSHLAGALGKPVWTLLPGSPEWRYPRSGDAMPWYPSMRLFRRALNEGWAAVIERVTVALADKIRSTGRA